MYNAVPDKKTSGLRLAKLEKAESRQKLSDLFLLLCLIQIGRLYQTAKKMIK